MAQRIQTLSGSRGLAPPFSWVAGIACFWTIPAFSGISPGEVSRPYNWQEGRRDVCTTMLWCRPLASKGICIQSNRGEDGYAFPFLRLRHFLVGGKHSLTQLTTISLSTLECFANSNPSSVLQRGGPRRRFPQFISSSSRTEAITWRTANLSSQFSQRH